MIQGAATKIGIDRPNTVIGNNRTEVMELLELANEEGAELVTRPFQALRRELLFTTVATEAQTGMVPADYGYMISGTLWNRSTNRKLEGVVSPEVWQHLKSTASNTSYETLYMRGGDFLLMPIPPAGETIAGEYITKSFCRSAGGVEQSEWLADTDTSILPERLMKLGVVVRYKVQKGLDATFDLAQYQTQMLMLLAQDKPAQRVCLSGAGSIMRGLNVPETGYGS